MDQHNAERIALGLVRAYVRTETQTRPIDTKIETAKWDGAAYAVSLVGLANTPDHLKIEMHLAWRAVTESRGERPPSDFTSKTRNARANEWDELVARELITRMDWRGR